jgi:hypothetical protein
MAVGHRELRRNLLCSLGILGIIAVISLGLPALDRALPRLRAVPAGRPYPVSVRVNVVPPAGARLDVSRTRPGRTSGYAVFLVDGVSYALTVTSDRVDLATAAERLRTVLRDSVDATAAGVGQPLPGVDQSVAGPFRTPTLAGWYAVRLIGPSTVVQLTATGPADALERALPAIVASAVSVGRRT